MTADQDRFFSLGHEMQTAWKNLLPNLEGGKKESIGTCVAGQTLRYSSSSSLQCLVSALQTPLVTCRLLEALHSHYAPVCTWLQLQPESEACASS